MTYVDIVVLPWMQRMNVQQVHKNYNLKNELTDNEFVLYKRWCDAINEHEAVAPTTPEPFYMINVSLFFHFKLSKHFSVLGNIRGRRL